MIEINPKIIDSNLLEERVWNQMKNKNISTIKTDSFGTLYKDMQSVRNNFLIMNSIRQIKECPIQSHRKTIGKAIVFSKKVFRKLTRWLFASYYKQQNEFNAAVVRVIEDMIRIQESLIEKMEHQNAD